MKSFKLIISHPASAHTNMDTDAMILQKYLSDAIPVFRVYRWSAPSFTYGISQNPHDVLNIPQCEADGVDVVQRMTGGGVLFHHQEITYSFACSKYDVRESDKELISYRHICAFLMRFYKMIGLDACFASEHPQFNQKSSPHELCSASHEKFDITINGKKIGGNAQKRIRQAVFQHGSIPLSIDWDLMSKYVRLIPENISESVTTLSEELSGRLNPEEIQQKLMCAFKEEFCVNFMERYS